MSIYISVRSEPLRSACVAAAKELENEQVIEAQSNQELMDFLALRRGARPGQIRLLILELGMDEDPEQTLGEMADLAELAITPVLVIIDRGRLPAVRAMSKAMLVDSLLTPDEASVRVKAAARLAESLRARLESDREVRSILRKEREVIESRDAATDLPGHATFVQFLEREWNRCLRCNWEISLILCRLQGWSDRMEGSAIRGRESEVLRSIAESIRDCAHRPGDLAATVENGRFGVILSETGGPGAAHVLHRLHLAVEEALERYAINDKVFFRVGLASANPLELYRSIRTGNSIPGHTHLLQMASAQLSEAENT